MARRKITQYFDDMDNTPLDEDELNVIRFGYEGTEYILDLSDDNAREFREIMEPYVRAARKVSSVRGSRRGEGSSTGSRGNSREIREWALSQGMKVANRGKIPMEIINAYEEAHS